MPDPGPSRLAVALRRYAGAEEELFQICSVARERLRDAGGSLLAAEMDALVTRSLQRRQRMRQLGVKPAPGRGPAAEPQRDDRGRPRRAAADPAAGRLAAASAVGRASLAAAEAFDDSCRALREVEGGGPAEVHRAMHLARGQLREDAEALVRAVHRVLAGETDDRR